MTSKIFKTIISVATMAILATVIVITAVLYNYFERVQENQLKNDLNFAAYGTESMGEDYLKNVVSEDYRLTLIKPDGTVVYDNKVDAKKLENHRSREEIKQAEAVGVGSSSRYSSTLTEKTIYEAKKLSDGSVLRISANRKTLGILILGMIQPIIIIVIAAIALAAWFARVMSKRIVEPLNKLDLDDPMNNNAYDELSPLLHRIYVQHQEIDTHLESLKSRKEEFEQITKSMKEALILLDQNDRILSINPAAISLLSTDEKCIGSDFLTVNRRRDMRRAVASAKKKGHNEFRTNMDGRTYQFDLSKIEYNGEEKGLAILAFDVSEQVNAEKNRREFTANVSHELRTPLQSIIGSAELMENGMVKNEDVPRFVGHIRKEASRLVNLIEDIIRLSQIDEGGEMPQEELNVKDIAEEVIDSLKEYAEERNIDITLSGDQGRMLGVRRLLHEIVYNLVDNAIKYNKEAGKVDVNIFDVEGKVMIEVSDTGVGIPKEDESKVFERFYRVCKCHSQKVPGTGLGLSIVKHAVAYHNGTIKVDSEVGKGTVITVVFDKTA